MSLAETLGATGQSVLNKLGAPVEVTSQLAYDDVQIQGAALSLWRIDVTKVWANTNSFSFAIKIWCNVDASGHACLQAQAQKLPHPIKGTVDRTFNISGKCSFALDFFTAQEIEVLKERAASLFEDPTITFGQNGSPNLFLKAENPLPTDGLGFTLSTSNVWSATSNCNVDVINLGGLAIQGLRLGGNGIAGAAAEPVKQFIPRSVPVAPQSNVPRPPVAPSTAYTFEVIH